MLKSCRGSPAFTERGQGGPATPGTQAEKINIHVKSPIMYSYTLFEYYN